MAVVQAGTDWSGKSRPKKKDLAFCGMNWIWMFMTLRPAIGVKFTGRVDNLAVDCLGQERGEE